MHRLPAIFLGGEFQMQSLLNDVRFNLRQLFKNPGFSLTTVISLGLGIGATMAVFSVVYAIMMNPLCSLRPHGSYATSGQRPAGNGIRADGRAVAANPEVTGHRRRIRGR